MIKNSVEKKIHYRADDAVVYLPRMVSGVKLLNVCWREDPSHNGQIRYKPITHHSINGYSCHLGTVLPIRAHFSYQHDLLVLISTNPCNHLAIPLQDSDQMSKAFEHMSRRVWTITPSVISKPWASITFSSIHEITSRIVCLSFTMPLSSTESACSVPSPPSLPLYLKFGTPFGGSNSSKAGAFSMLYADKIQWKKISKLLYAKCKWEAYYFRIKET